MKKKTNQKNLRIFFIKLVSATIAAIILLNVMFNLLIFNIPYIQTLFSLTDLESRRDYGNKLRDDLNNLLKKDTIIKKEDRVLIYNFYKKIKSEFEEIK